MPSMTTERVWEEFHAPLQQFIRRRVSDEAEALDILQDVFLRIHQHMDTLKDVRKLEGWIYQITLYAFPGFFRKTAPRLPSHHHLAAQLRSPSRDAF